MDLCRFTSPKTHGIATRIGGIALWSISSISSITDTRSCSTAHGRPRRDRANDERFSFYVASLFEQGTEEIKGRGLPGRARISAFAHLVREARNPDGLRATHALFFGMPVSIDEHI